MSEKYDKLLNILKASGGAAVAFSGGVDSSFLCYAAVQALGEKALAVTVVSPMLPQSEVTGAREFARAVGINHVTLTEHDIDEEVAANPRDRCYHCKKIEFAAIAKAARERGIATVFDGSNKDDEGDYRPGLRAVAELGIRGPLREAGLTKAEIRELSRKAGLSTWDKPALACLASRFPYGEKINAEKLARVEKAEDVLRALGFRQYRVRSHGDIARIEVAPEERKLFFSEAVLDELSEKIKATGFLYAALELSGYAAGNMNRALTGEATK